MAQRVRELLEALIKARSFEDGAEATLRSLIAVAEGALAASPYARSGKITRGSIHLLPGGAYTRLHVVEAAKGAKGSPAEGDDALPSTSAWAWIVAHEQPIAIDLNEWKVDAIGAKKLVIDLAQTRAPRGNATAVRMTIRNTTHLAACPIHASGGGVNGMITLEATCRGAMGSDFVFHQCGEELELLANVAAPFLDVLKPRPRPEVDENALLPVIGPTMGPIVNLLRSFAQKNETILIGGATGTGKSRIAKWCHDQSRRSQQPFESVDLSTTQDTLQRKVLFGVKRGAYTGADADEPGAIARAEGGTVFIDEIDKLSLEVQAALLRLLEEDEYAPIGGGPWIKAKVRFLIGTNADLRERVKAGAFREDLFFRINVLPVKLPALDERRDELVRWADYFANRAHLKDNLPGVAALDDSAATLLRQRDWPGNLRQLDNVVKRAHLFAEGTADATGVTITESHVLQALAADGTSNRHRGSFLDAAAAFVDEAERRYEAKQPALDYEVTDGFLGFVLGLAVRRHGRDEAFRILGKESMLAPRNHHKKLLAALDATEKLCKELNLPFPFDDVRKESPKAR